MARAVFPAIAPALHRNHAPVAVRLPMLDAEFMTDALACLSRVARGRQARKTADDRGIFRRVVAAHVAVSTARLGTANHIEAVAIAVRASLFK